MTMQVPFPIPVPMPFPAMYTAYLPPSHPDAAAASPLQPPGTTPQQQQQQRAWQQHYGLPPALLSRVMQRNAALSAAAGPLARPDHLQGLRKLDESLDMNSSTQSVPGLAGLTTRSSTDSYGNLVDSVEYVSLGRLMAPHTLPAPSPMSLLAYAQSPGGGRLGARSQAALDDAAHGSPPAVLQPAVLQPAGASRSSGHDSGGRGGGASGRSSLVAGDSLPGHSSSSADLVLDPEPSGLAPEPSDLDPEPVLLGRAAGSSGASSAQGQPRTPEEEGAPGTGSSLAGPAGAPGSGSGSGQPRAPQEGGTPGPGSSLTGPGAPGSSLTGPGARGSSLTGQGAPGSSLTGPGAPGSSLTGPGAPGSGSGSATTLPRGSGEGGPGPGSSGAVTGRPPSEPDRAMPPATTSPTATGMWAGSKRAQAAAPATATAAAWRAPATAPAVSTAPTATATATTWPREAGPVRATATTTAWPVGAPTASNQQEELSKLPPMAPSPGGWAGGHNPTTSPGGWAGGHDPTPSPGGWAGGHNSTPLPSAAHVAVSAPG